MKLSKCLVYVSINDITVNETSTQMLYVNVGFTDEIDFSKCGIY